MMDWSQISAGDAIIGAPQGRVDEASWEVFLVAMTTSLEQAGDAGKRFILDMAGLDYMSSRGLRALTMARRTAEAKNVSITLARPNERMREILAISRYDKIFPVTEAL
jgi:anti-sigma B factor antagonist